MLTVRYRGYDKCLAMLEDDGLAGLASMRFPQKVMSSRPLCSCSRVRSRAKENMFSLLDREIPFRDYRSSAEVGSSARWNARRMSLGHYRVPKLLESRQHDAAQDLTVRARIFSIRLSIMPLIEWWYLLSVHLRSFPSVRSNTMSSTSSAKDSTRVFFSEHSFDRGSSVFSYFLVIKIEGT